MKLTSLAAAIAAAVCIAPQALAAPAPRLHEGSTGPAVIKLQRSLHLKADGVFGPGTQTAVMYFQARYGLATDGIVGPGTWKVLGQHGSIESILASFDKRTVVAAKAGGWAIELRLNGDAGSTRVLRYSSGHWSLPVASPSSSAGWAYNKYGVLTHYTTCTGVYSLMKRDPAGINAYSQTYHAPMAWAYYWCGAIAFHQDPLVPSHGCVHLPSYADAQFMWENLPAGTQVLSENQPQ